MSCNSIVPSTAEWLARICSTKVEPERGSPTMKIGSGAVAPQPCRSAKNSAVNVARARRTNLEVSSGA
jgi:hypothetical protein